MKGGAKGLHAITWFAGVFLALGSGCAPQENLIVPPASQRLGTFAMKQTYVLQRPTIMASMDTGTAQPEIHLPYDAKKDGAPPAEAVERVPFPVGYETTETDTDSNGNTYTYTVWVPTFWGWLTLNVGTQLSVSSVEVYSNSHVYRGRVMNGPAHNVHVLLVVPIADKGLPVLANLEREDQTYLSPLTPATPPDTRAVTQP
jgi:hypothetical protein